MQAPPSPPPPPPSNPTPEKTKGDDVVVDLKLQTEETVIECETDSEADDVCRICHVSPDRPTETGSDLIDIGCGCGCKDGLGTAHRHCAETWFKQKGNRCCEICGSNAKNITGFENQGFMEVWHERRIVPAINTSRTSQPERENRCWRRRSFCNFLMACLVVAFILPWFFHVNMF